MLLLGRAFQASASLSPVIISGKQADIPFLSILAHFTASQSRKGTRAVSQSNAFIIQRVNKAKIFSNLKGHLNNAIPFAPSLNLYLYPPIPQYSISLLITRLILDQLSPSTYKMFFQHSNFKLMSYAFIYAWKCQCKSALNHQFTHLVPKIGYKF